MSAPLLVLRRFGVAFGDQIVLSALRLEIGPRGAVALMGPAGGGKSDEQSAFLIQFAERLRRQTLAPSLREPALR